MGTLNGKIAVITGAARGNGEGSAIVMAEKGATVVLTDVMNTVHKTAKKIIDNGYIADSFEMDVADTSQVSYVVKEVEKKFGRIDILVNNAGVINLVSLINMVDEVRDRMLDTNIKGVFNCTKAVLPGMMKRNYGKIVNLSSVTGPIVADAGETAYATTKAAIWGFTRALAIEVAQYGINVNAICPGMIETEMVKQMAMETDPNNPSRVIKQMASRIPLGRLGTIEELGELVVFLASDRSSYLTGASIVMDGASTLPESGVFVPQSK